MKATVSNRSPLMSALHILTVISTYERSLTLNLLNLWNGVVQLSFLEPSIVNFGDIKMRIWSWSANSIEPGQIARMCRLDWLYISG